MEAKRALITGITGQDGSYLAELLLEKGYEVYGMVRRSSTENFERIEHLLPRLELHQADLLDQLSLIRMLEESRPHEVYNLAAQSFVPTSWTQPVLTAEFTALGVTRLLEAIRLVDPGDPLLPGLVERDVRQGARDAADRAHAVPPAQPLRRGQGVRPLDHRQLPRELRPLRLLGHPLQSRVAAARARVRDAQGDATPWPGSSSGFQRELRLGNLDAQRDWGFAGDYVQAMWLMLQQDEPDDYVVATGETHSVRELVELAFGHVGLDWQEYVVVDPTFKRPAEVDLLLGDAAQGAPEARLGAEGRASPSSSG